MNCYDDGERAAQG